MSSAVCGAPSPARRLNGPFPHHPLHIFRIYVSARAWDSAPESEWVANEMRRDTNQLRQNDTSELSNRGFVIKVNRLLRL